MAIPHASIARLSSFMMLLDPDPAGEITASLSRDRGMGDVVRRNLDGSVAAIPVACVLRVAQVRRRRLQRGDTELNLSVHWPVGALTHMYSERRGGRTDVGSAEAKNRGRQRAS